MGGAVSGAVGAVLGMYAAIRDGRVADLLALVDSGVVCLPLVRPGLSVYEGHAGMAELVADMHAAHGDYRVQVDQVQEEPGAGVTVVTVAVTIVPGAGYGPPLPVTSSFTVRGGLITVIESKNPAGAGVQQGGSGAPDGHGDRRAAGVPDL